MKHGFIAIVLLTAFAGSSAAQGTNANAVRGRISERMVVGSTTLGDVLRIVGSSTVSSGNGTINPAVIDADGDVLEDNNTTVSTAGAWTFGSAATFNNTMAVIGASTFTGTLSGAGGTLLLASPTRISTTAPAFRLHESDAATDEKYTELLADGGVLSLDLVDDALGSRNTLFKTDRAALVPGDWRWGSLLGNVRPENNGGTSLGSLTKKYLTLHAWELWVQTLVAQNTIATIGGRIFVAPTTELTRDVASGDTVIYVKHNQSRTNDTLLLQKNGLFEKMLVTSSYTDCSVSGNCSPSGSDYKYTVTRNRDGTGANDWAAGDAVMNEGNTGDGYIDLYSDRSATAEGYVGQVISDGPVAYWRMEAATSTTTVDQMGNVGVATETGTQSNGLGVNAFNLGTTGSDPTWQNTGGAGYLTVTDDADLRITGDLTIEFFAYWEHTVSQGEHILSRVFNGEYYVDVDASGVLRFCQGNGTTFECETTSTAVMPVGSFNHFVIVRDATSSPKRVLFYKDGVLTDTTTYTQSVTTSTNNLLIGSTSGGTTPFDGYLDEVAIYNYQLSADRILLHYNARANDSISKFTVGPTLCGNVRTGTGAFDLAERWCVGNLAGTSYSSSSVTPRYGFAAGSTGGDWIDATAADGFRVMYQNVEKMKASGGNLSLTGNLTIASGGSIIGGNYTINNAGQSVDLAASATLDNPFAYRWNPSTAGGSQFMQGYLSGSSRGLYFENSVDNGKTGFFGLRATANTTDRIAHLTISADDVGNISQFTFLVGSDTLRFNDLDGIVWDDPYTTTGSSTPLVIDSNGKFLKKTDGFSGTCFSPSSLVIENGIVTSCS